MFVIELFVFNNQCFKRLPIVLNRCAVIVLNRDDIVFTYTRAVIWRYLLYQLIACTSLTHAIF